MPTTDRLQIDGVDYMVRDSELMNAVNSINGVTIISFTKDKYIKTSGNVGDHLQNLTPINSTTGYMYAVVDCTAGDVFTITGYGGNDPRLWCFINTSNSNEIRGVAPSGTAKNLFTITAPENANKLIINSNRANTFAIMGEVNSGMPRQAVAGPDSSIDGHVALFDGETGKAIKDADISISGLAKVYNPEFVGSISMGRLPETAIGNLSVAEGFDVAATGTLSRAEGYHTIANKDVQTVSGLYNVADTTSTASDNFLEIVGNGTADNARSNARALRRNGDECLKGDLYVQCNENSTGGSKVATVSAVAAVSASVENLSDTLAEKADKANPVVTGSISLGRKKNTTVGQYSSAIGYNVTASAIRSHAEGYESVASADGAHAEGSSTASGDSAHAEGSVTVASGNYSHTEGQQTKAKKDSAHAEGYNTTANGNYAHAEGENSTASGTGSHAEGYSTTASGNYSHTEGYQTTASGTYSHAEGYGTTASGLYSHAEGIGTIASKDGQHVFGNYNISDANTGYSSYLEIVGNGSSNARSNARALSLSGNEYVAGAIYTNFDFSTGVGSKVATENYVTTVTANKAEINDEASNTSKAWSASKIISYVNEATAGGSGGNMIGPESSVDGRIPLFSGSTGKVLKDSGCTWFNLPEYVFSQGKSYPVNAAYFSSVIEGFGTTGQAGSSTAEYRPTTWYFDVPFDFNEGDIVTVKVPAAGVNAGVWVTFGKLDPVTGSFFTDWCPVALNGTSILTTQYGTDAIVALVYEKNRTTSIYGTDKDGAPAGSSKTTYTGDRWAVLNYYDSNTTYSVMTTAETTAGTGTGSRVIQPRYLSAGLKAAIVAGSTNGHLSVYGQDNTIYTLPTASSSTLGGVKVGNGLSVDANGVISASGSFSNSITIGNTTITEAQLQALLASIS